MICDEVRPDTRNKLGNASKDPLFFMGLISIMNVCRQQFDIPKYISFENLLTKRSEYISIIDTVIASISTIQ